MINALHNLNATAMLILNQAVVNADRPAGYRLISHQELEDMLLGSAAEAVKNPPEETQKAITAVCPDGSWIVFAKEWSRSWKAAVGARRPVIIPEGQDDPEWAYIAGPENTEWDRTTERLLKQPHRATLKKTIYLANPYGFSEQQKRLLLPEIMEALEALNLEPWEPFTRNNQPSDLNRPGWAYRTGQADMQDVRHADAMLAVVNGTPPDEGVMVELGAAIALNKPTFLFRDDFRKVTDSEDYPLNLMLFTGMPAEGWERHYYTSVSELLNPEKALAQWAAQIT